MSYDVRFHNVLQVRDGVACPTRVGVGPDGTLWLDPDDLGISPEEVRNMVDYPGPGPLMLLDDGQRRVFVNAQALAATQADPEVGRAMGNTIDMLLDALHPTNFRK